jgi:hypothetical protein
MHKVTKHIAVIQETNLKKIDETDKFRLILSVLLAGGEKPHLLNYEIDNLENLQQKFQFAEGDIAINRIPRIEQRKCIINDDNKVYSFVDFI